MTERVTPAMRSVPPGLGALLGSGLGVVTRLLTEGCGALEEALQPARVRASSPANQASDFWRLSRSLGLRLRIGSSFVQQSEADDRSDPHETDRDREAVE